MGRSSDVTQDILDLKTMMAELTVLANEVLIRTEVIAEKLAPSEPPRRRAGDAGLDD